jgi:drug/metabolite transporter (DMT)-like permease
MDGVDEGILRSGSTTNVITIAVWIATCVLWSSTFLFIKLGLRDIPPFTFAWLRLAVAVAVLAPLTIARGRWRTFSLRDVVHVAGTGVVLLGINYGLIFWGAQFVPSGLVAILQSGTPVIALAFGWAFGSEHVNARKIVAVTVGVVGVTIIFGSQARVSGPHAILGSLAVFCGSTCVAFAYVWLKTYGQHLHRTSVTTLQSCAGLVPLLLAGLWLEGGPLPSQWALASWIALLYLALFASVLAFWLNYWLLARMDASAMLLMGVAEIPVAVMLGAVVFGERLPGGTLLGASCVLAAVVAGLSGRSDRRASLNG